MDCTRLARREKASSRAVADDTLGEVVCGGLAVEVSSDGRQPLHIMYVGRGVKLWW